MTLAELGMAFWHDLAAPVIAGILASMIVNWQFAPGSGRRGKLCGLFRSYCG